MLSTLLMKGYETFEGAYAQVLSGLARNRLALAVAGRVSQHRNLLERWITIQKDQALARGRVPSVKDIEDVLAAIHRLERTHRRMERQLEQMRSLLDETRGGA